MFHATALVQDYDATVEPLVRLFGCRVLHDNVIETPGIARRGGMTWIGDNSIEIGEPAAEGSPVQKFVDDFGGGMHSVAVQIDDVEQRAVELERLGVRVAAKPLPGIMFTHPADTAGLLLQWSSSGSPDDPRGGGSVPPLQHSPVVLAQRFAFVAALARDTSADATRLAEVLGTEATVLTRTPDADTVGAVVALGDCALALFPLADDDTSQRLWGAVHRRPRFVAIGLQIDDLAAAVEKLADVGISAARRAGDMVMVQTGAAALPVMLTGQLLPGDPRLAGRVHHGDA
jgi:catechol 2,3-dioxygenase-like lactoylglutathione lyase family enzyme